MLKAKVSITLDIDVLESVKKLAEQDDRNVSQYINVLLKRYIKEKEENKQEMKP